MQYCEKCKVKITGINQCCPLCKGDLTGNQDETTKVFPKAKLKKQSKHILLKTFLLCSVIAAFICAALNISLKAQGLWSLFVFAGLISIWLIIGIVFKKRQNPMRTILCFSLITSLLALLWDVMTGFFGWSTNFVLPFLYTFTIVITSLTIPIFRLKKEDYLFYLSIEAFLGIIPLVLLLLNIIKTAWPSAICAASSFITLAALVIFNGPAFKEELSRRFHI